ncbi:MAG: hypothetical protein PHC62_00905 [Candidatus Izemoplasmatales bacterium]|nr:hypothetical protein [Candidatus Izemoplasmatales bacterium]
MYLENSIELESFNFQMNMLEIEQTIFMNELKYKMNINLNENVEVINEGVIETFKKVMKAIFKKIKEFIDKIIAFFSGKKQEVEDQITEKRIEKAQEKVRNISKGPILKSRQQTADFDLVGDPYGDDEDLKTKHKMNKSISNQPLGISRKIIVKNVHNYISTFFSNYFVNIAKKVGLSGIDEDWIVILRELVSNKSKDQINDYLKKKDFLFMPSIINDRDAFGKILNEYGIPYNNEKTFDEVFESLNKKIFYLKDEEFDSLKELDGKLESLKKSLKQTTDENKNVKKTLERRKKEIIKYERDLDKIKDSASEISELLTKFSSSTSKINNLYNQCATFCYKMLNKNRNVIKLYISAVERELSV